MMTVMITHHIEALHNHVPAAMLRDRNNKGIQFLWGKGILLSYPLAWLPHVIKQILIYYDAQSNDGSLPHHIWLFG